MKSQEVIAELARASKSLCDAGLTIADTRLSVVGDEKVKKAVIRFHQRVNASHRELINLIKHFSEDLSDVELDEVGKKAGWKKTS